LSCNPEVKLHPAADVRAFRVDTRTWYDVDLGGTIGGNTFARRDVRISTSRRLSEVQQTSTNQIDQLIKPSLSQGWFVSLLLFANGAGCISHSVALQLYRPGFDLVEVESWDVPQRIEWRVAADLETQEKALDQLFKPSLEPGSTAEAHRQALLFGADEYDRLAGCSPSGDSPKRLTEKAVRLRERANE